MFARSLGRAAAAIAILASVGCATTKVNPNPGPDDCGFRYYRAKPYLLVQANTGTDAGATHTYTLSLQALPDYSEEFSIHISPGLGLNTTNITYDTSGYGMLTGVNVALDSNAANLLNAFSTLLGTTPNLLRSGAAGGGSMGQTEKTLLAETKLEVLGYNVPVGYYEAVVSRGPDGVKRMYGWRYLGFAPFAPCPIESGGAVCTTCTEADLFGLVTVGNKMFFRRLSELANNPVTGTVQQDRRLTSPPNTGANPGTPAVPPEKKKDEQDGGEEPAKLPAPGGSAGNRTGDSGSHTEAWTRYSSKARPVAAGLPVSGPLAPAERKSR